MKYEKNKYYSNIFTNNNQTENWRTINISIYKSKDNLPTVLEHDGRLIYYIYIHM